jgi:hypothetical protein
MLEASISCQDGEIIDAPIIPAPVLRNFLRDIISSPQFSKRFNKD